MGENNIETIFRVSLFESKYDTTPKPAERTWQMICERMQKPHVRKEKDGALFSPAVFDPPHRKKENVLEVSLLVLDYDHGADFDRDTALWRGQTFAAYTTHSSYRVTESNPDAEERFRVIVPFVEPIPASEFPALWQWAARMSCDKVDASAKDASRMFYTPAIASPDARYRFAFHDGAPLDWRALNLQAETDSQQPATTAPPMLLGPGTRDAYAQTALRDETARVLTAANGQRNETLNRAAFSLGQFVASGLLTESEVETMLERAAIGVGLSVTETRATIKSGLIAGLKEPRTVPQRAVNPQRADGTSNQLKAETAKAKEKPEEWEPPAAFNEYDLPEFPVDSLPNWLRAFVTGLARETQTPADLTAMLTLAACAGAVAGNVEIEARRGWREPLNLFIVVALPPGNRKSAVFSSVTQPLESFEASLISEQREVVARAESERRMLAARLDHLEKTVAKAKNENDRRTKQQEAAQVAQELAAMDVPKSPRILADDATPETLATLLNDQAGRIALFSPEGDLFDLMGGRYSNGAPNLGVFLKGHAGDALRVDRRGRSEYVKRPALTIGLAVQPDVIRGLVSKPTFKGRGLLGRILYSLPQSTLGSRKIRVTPLDEEARAEYARRLKMMAGLRVEPDTDDGRQARMLRLTADADDCLAAFESEIEPQLAETGKLGMHSDWAGKLPGAVLRIAGILHLGEHAGHFQNWPERVNADTLKRAIEIGRYLMPHAQVAYAEMGADPEIEAAKVLLRWIEKTSAESFTKRQVFEATKGRFKKVENLEPALRLLEEQGYIRALCGTGSAGRGRKASQLFEVNPFFLSGSHNSHNSQNASHKLNFANCANTANDPEGIILEKPFSAVRQWGSEAREVFTV